MRCSRSAGQAAPNHHPDACCPLICGLVLEQQVWEKALWDAVVTGDSIVQEYVQTGTVPGSGVVSAHSHGALIPDILRPLP
jgi:hypothetical protein